MNERVVRSECVIGCQGSIEIDVPFMYMCATLVLSSTKLKIKCVNLLFGGGALFAVKVPL